MSDAALDGFEAFLDEAEFVFGQLEPAADDEQRMTLRVETDHGDHSVDAIGIDKRAGQTVLLAFEWAALDADALREKATDAGVVLSEAEQSQIDAAAGEETCVLTEILPWREVRSVSLGDEFLSVFDGLGESE